MSFMTVPPRLSEGRRPGCHQLARTASISYGPPVCACVLLSDVVSPSACASVFGVLGFATDRDALGLVLGLGRPRQGHGKHAVAERRLSLVLLNRKRQRDHPLEAAIVALI